MMWKYVLKRVLQLAIVFLAVTLFTFALTSNVPYSNVIPRGSEGTPFFLNHIAWMRHIFLAENAAFTNRRTLFENFGAMIPGTLRLIGVSLFVVVFLSVPLGILTAIKKDSPLDYILRFFSFLGMSIPSFVFGIILIFTFCLRFNWFSVINSTGIKGIVLPVCTLSTPLIARYVRQVRGAVLEELHQDYVTGASARGVSQGRILLSHILPNAMAPVLSSMGVIIGYLLSGVVVVESMFVRQGIGSITMQSIRIRDYSVIQAYVLWMAIFYIAARFVIDILVYIFDPLLRRKGGPPRDVKAA